MIVRTDDHREIYYQSSGAGQMLLLVHGAGPTHFEELARDLSLQFRCISFDRLGFKKSTHLDRNTTISEQASSIEALRRDISPDPVWIMGWSSGANFSLAYALAHPAQVRGLILIEPALYAIYAPDEKPSEIDRMAEAVDLIHHGEIEQGWDGFIEVIFGYRRNPKEEPPRTDEELDQMRSFGYDQPVVISWCPSVEELRGLTTPVLVIEGDQSPALLRDISHRLHARLPNSTVVTLEGENHMMPIRSPSVVAEQISAFVCQYESGLSE